MKAPRVGLPPHAIGTINPQNRAKHRHFPDRAPLTFKWSVQSVLLTVVTKNDYIEGVTSKELKRWLEKQGATLSPGKGSHLHVELNGKFSVLPMHGKDLGQLANAIKKQLGLK